MPIRFTILLESAERDELLRVFHRLTDANHAERSLARNLHRTRGIDKMRKALEETRSKADRMKEMA